MSSHPHPSVYRGDQRHAAEPKRHDGFFGPSIAGPAPHQFQLTSLFGSQHAYQFSSSFTDEELLASLASHPTNNPSQPISSEQAPRPHQPHPNPAAAHPHPQHHHHPIAPTTTATSPETGRHGSFCSSVPLEDHLLLLSPSSSTHPTHAPSPAISSLSATHHPLRASRSPQPKPLSNRHTNYPFSPPTSITTTLADEERSPAISTISVNEPTTHHSLSSSQPIGSSFYRPMTSADASAGLRSPIDRMSAEPSLSSSLPTRRTFSPHPFIDQQKLVLNEKRRKRRESHNAVERRRRDNINDRITELAGLLPTCLLDTVVTPSESGMMMVVNEEPSQTDDGQPLNSTAPAKPNKGMILAKSVDYIKHLKHLLELQSQRNAELEAELRNLRSTTTDPHNPDQEQGGWMAGEEETNLEGNGNAVSARDQIHEWIKIHDQQTCAQKNPFEEQNIMMMATESHPYRAGQERSHVHHPSDSDSASLTHLNPQAPFEAFKPNETRFQSPHDHFSSPFNHHLDSFESMYYHLQ